MTRAFLPVVMLAATGLTAAPALGQSQSQNPRQQGHVTAPDALPPVQPARPRATPAQSGTANKISKRDRNFLDEAAEGGMMEIQAGQLAASKATNDDVKKLGQKMVDDHTKVNNDVQSLAQKKGVNLPTKLDKDEQAELDKLSKLNGTDFDRAYVRDMLRDHRKDVSDFDKAAKSAKDPDVKSLAAQALPTLQEHLTMAEDLDKKLNAK